MTQAVAALFGAGFTVAACYAAGTLLIDQLHVALRPPERVPLAFLLGAACLHLAMFAVMALRIAYTPVIVAVLAGLIGAAVWKGSWRDHKADTLPLSMSVRILLGVCLGAFGLLYFLHAWAPEGSPDGSSYHLGLIARYLRNHGFERITTSFYAMLPEGVEMLYVPAFAIGRHSAAALVHLCFAVALALMILAYGRRIGKPWVGAAAAVLTFVSPISSGSGRGVCIRGRWHGSDRLSRRFYWLEIWDQLRDWQLLVPAGLLVGYAYATKYTAVMIAIYALGFVAWRARQLKPVLLVAVCSLSMAGPWVARDSIWYQNPVAPMGNWLFRNPYVHVMFEKDWSADQRRLGVENKWALPLEVTLRGEKTQGLIGPAFLLMPLALLALRQAAGRRLLLVGLLVFSTYFGNIATRFLIPSLPFFSLALALALESPPLLAALMIFHAITSFPKTIPLYASRDAGRLVGVPYREALRLVPEDQALRKLNFAYSATRMVETSVPEGERVFAMNGIMDAYTSREVLVNFLSAENQTLGDTINMGWSEILQPLRERSFQFAGTTTRRIRVVQTAQVDDPAEQWNVHELRFYSDGQELARRPEWKPRAWPNPWDVQLALDNSPVTRWRSWETAFPGMFLEIDFGKDEVVDEVRLETSEDYKQVHLQVESMNSAGQWERLGGEAVDRTIAPPPSIRCLAIREMHNRGIHYLLMFDTDYGAGDFRDDPEAWGLKPIASTGGARLYRDVW